MWPWREVPLKPLQGLVLGRAELRKREEGLSPRNRLTFGERRESHRARYEYVPERPIAQGVPHERPARRNPDGDPCALVGTSGPSGVMLPPSRRRRARRGSGRHGDDLVWLLCRDARHEDRDADEYSDRPSHPLEGTGGKNPMVPWPPWQRAPGVTTYSQTVARQACVQRRFLARREGHGPAARNGLQRPDRIRRHTGGGAGSERARRRDVRRGPMLGRGDARRQMRCVPCAQRSEGNPGRRSIPGAGHTHLNQRGHQLVADAV